MPTLTLDEARERAALLDVDSYRIDLDVDRGSEVFGSSTTIRFGCRQPGASTFVELRAERLHRAVLNGEPLDLSTYAGNRLPLPVLQQHNELTVEADVRYSRAGEGMHRFDDPADGQTYVGAYCGTDLAQRVFACFDQPDLKGRFEVSATAPDGWSVVANGVADQPEAGRWRFTPTPPLSTYLFVLVAGPWHTVRAEHRGRPFALHGRASLAAALDADADDLFATTFACFDRYLEMFDEPYPFDSFDQAFVPGLSWGALETPGCITYRDEMLFRSAVTDTERQSRAVTMAHEMAHLWFGDLVTMSWWDDLWLSESFADYWGTQVATEVTRFTGAWTDITIKRKAWGYDADQRPSTHPVAPRREDVGDADSALANADGITYAKGAAALRQLVTWLGPDTFLAGVNAFLARHRFGNATLADLVHALGEASGRDVAAWGRSWLETTAPDTLVATRRPGVLRLQRRGARPHVLAVGVFDTGDEPGSLVRTATLQVALDGEVTDVALPGGGDPALLVVNDGDLTYAKVRPDERSWAAVTDALSGIGDPSTRALLWVTARDLVRDGELAPASYLDTVARHLPAETDPAVVGAVLGFARHDVADQYLDADARPTALASLAGTCRALMTAGEAGVRLAAARVLIDCALGDDGLADEIAATGLALDDDLRWRLLLRRCVLGLAGADEIDARLADDPSSAGDEGALRCRGALPDQASKERTFTALFGPGPGALSARQYVAAGQGMWWPEQAELLAPFVGRFFEVAAAVARERGQGIAAVMVPQAFPGHVVDRAVLDAGLRCLERDDPPPALRRPLADRLDDLARALRVRQR